MMMTMMLLLLDADNGICGERKETKTTTFKRRQHHIEHQLKPKPNGLAADCTSKQVVDKSRVCEARRSSQPGSSHFELVVAVINH